MNENMPKWIFASLCKFFNETAITLGLPFYAEGADDPTSEVYQSTNLSFRVDGPMVVESSSLSWYRVETQGLLTEIGRPTNRYSLHGQAGEVAKAMRGGIPVYQIPESPATLVGCLFPDPSTRDSVRVVNLGMLSASSKVRQISVIGKYFIEQNT